MNGTTLKAISVVLAAAGMLAPLPARTAEPSDELAALEKKLHGDWVGHGACAGEITFRPDGTYEDRHVGPSGYNSAGNWDIRWDALPPTLVLSPKTSDTPGGLGKRCPMKILELDKGLVVDCGSKKIIRYERPEIEEARAIEISKAHVASRENWSDRALYEAKRVERGWSILVWREPKTPGGHRMITLRPNGRLIDYVRGR
jgi:hypothetical protein